MSDNLQPSRRSTSQHQFLLRLACIFLLLAGSVIGHPVAAERGKPLSSKDVSDLLDGSVPSSEIARVVTENGISFHMTDDLERQFRQAGATDDLIDALRKADKPEESPPPPPPVGTLKVQSQPGEALVFVNDEPKGPTSPSGELRLPNLPPGSYHVRVALTGYKTWENTLTVTANESVTAFVTLEKQNLEPTVTLDTDRSSIEAGQSVYLRWNSSNASDVDIEPGVGKVALAGATSVSPRESTTYTLTAIGPGGIKTATTYVGVTAPPPPPPVYQPPVGNMPGLPVPGATFQALKFFESEVNPPPLGSRVYSTQFNHRTTRYVSWELSFACPASSSPISFTINSTYYYPNGTVFSSPTMQATVNAGWPNAVFNAGWGWTRPGNWRRGTFRVDLAVNGNHIASGYFTIY